MGDLEEHGEQDTGGPETTGDVLGVGEPQERRVHTRLGLLGGMGHVC